MNDNDSAVKFGNLEVDDENDPGTGGDHEVNLDEETQLKRCASLSPVPLGPTTRYTLRG